MIGKLYPGKVPVLQISGTNDMVVPMDGTMSAAGGWGARQI